MKKKYFYWFIATYGSGFWCSIRVKDRFFAALFLQINGPERLWLNLKTSEQTVLTENLRSILTQLKMSIPLWLNWNDSWYFVVTVFCGFLKFVKKVKIRHRSILYESVKKQISIFHSEKGMFPFIVTANYYICSILLCLNSIDVECFYLVYKNKTISGFWQTFFLSFEMEVIEESDFIPNISKGTYKFVL